MFACPAENEGTMKPKPELLQTRLNKNRAPDFFKKLLKKKSRAAALLGKLCRPYFPECLDLSLIDGATLLVRARAPPETWTTRRKPCGLSEG
jgi:hypothetical protein